MITWTENTGKKTYTATIGKYSFIIYRSGWDNKWHADAKPTTDKKFFRSWNIFTTLKAAKRCCEGFAL